MMEPLSRKEAHNIIKALASSGQPPMYGVQYYTVGLDSILDTFDREYLSDHIKEGGSAFKMVIATYGSGKTHLMYSVRDRAWDQNHAVALVTLNQNSVAFHKLDQVYQEIARNVSRPLSPVEMTDPSEFGIPAIIRSYYSSKFTSYQDSGLSEQEAHQLILEDFSGIRAQSISFTRAFRFALEHINNELEFDKACQWLLGESNPDTQLKKAGVTEKIDRSTAFRMIRSLVQVLIGLGYGALTILFDEAEHISSLSGKNKQEHLGNLRELIDACFQSSFRHVFILYAVPDENFLTSGGNVYEALKQRVDTVFDRTTPSGVKVMLDDPNDEPEIMLIELGGKLRSIYEIGHDFQFPSEVDLDALIKRVATDAVMKRFADTGSRREFVKTLIAEFDKIRTVAK